MTTALDILLRAPLHARREAHTKLAAGRWRSAWNALSGDWAERTVRQLEADDALSMVRKLRDELGVDPSSPEGVATLRQWSQAAKSQAADAAPPAGAAGGKAAPETALAVRETPAAAPTPAPAAPAPAPSAPPAPRRGGSMLGYGAMGATGLGGGALLGTAYGQARERERGQKEKMLAFGGGMAAGVAAPRMVSSLNNYMGRLSGSGGALRGAQPAPPQAPRPPMPGGYYG